ncbi:hypothetical protein ACPA9J_05850 [Pseudomonas aeruginosa]
MGTYTYMKGGFPGEDLPGVRRPGLPDRQREAATSASRSRPRTSST